jgi:predicted  nucleic acid-binding Zn-ribbon protein
MSANLPLSFMDLCDRGNSLGAEYVTSMIEDIDRLIKENYPNANLRRKFVKAISTAANHRAYPFLINSAENLKIQLDNANKEIERLGKVIEELQNNRRLEKRRLELLEKNCLFD